MSEWETRLDNCMQAGSGFGHHRGPITSVIRARMSISSRTEANQNLVIRWSASKNILR
jgi:hypothetical protein